MDKKVVLKIVYPSIWILLFLLNNIDAQPSEEWKLHLGGSGGDFATSLLQTADGGYMVLANSNSTDGDLTPNFGGFDCFLIKMNANAQIEWKKNFGGTDSDKGNSIIQNSDGSYTVAGYSESNDGNLTDNNGSFDFWIFKVSESGNMEWSKNFGGSLDEFGDAIQPTSDGGYIVSGSTRSSNGDVSSFNGFQDGWLVKLDTDGNLEWEKSFGGAGGDWLRFGTQTNDSGYILTGSSSSINGDVETNNGATDLWILKVDQFGNLEWVKNYGGTESDFPRYIFKTEDDGYINGGMTYSDDGNVTGFYGESDIWIVKTDAIGNLEWEKNYGGGDFEVFRTLEITSDGGYVISGFSKSDDFDLEDNQGDFDFWLIKIDDFGNLQWSKTFGGSGEDRCDPILQTEDGGYILAGSSDSSNGDFDQNHGLADIWIIKLSPDPTQISEVDLNNQFKISPNPSNGSFEIRSLKQIPFDVKINNSIGQLVYSKDSIINKLEIANFTSGHYFINIETEGKLFISKLIVI